MKLEIYTVFDENDHVKFIQYKCLDCGNFEEHHGPESKLVKFSKIYVKNTPYLFRYICNNCHGETTEVQHKADPLSA